MLEARDAFVDHSSINRRSIRFLPTLSKFFRQYKRSVGASWRTDETYIKVKGVWKYLYRPADEKGKTINFLLTAKRDKVSDQDFDIIERHGYETARLTEMAFPYLQSMRQGEAAFDEIQQLCAERAGPLASVCSTPPDCSEFFDRHMEIGTAM